MIGKKIVVVTHATGKKELALLVETIPTPTAQVIDAHGAAYVVPAEHIAPATPADAQRYWLERSAHSSHQLQAIIRRCRSAHN